MSRGGAGLAAKEAAGVGLLLVGVRDGKDGGRTVSGIELEPTCSSVGRGDGGGGEVEDGELRNVGLAHVRVTIDETTRAMEDVGRKRSTKCVGWQTKEQNFLFR